MFNKFWESCNLYGGFPTYAKITNAVPYFRGFGLSMHKWGIFALLCDLLQSHCVMWFFWSNKIRVIRGPSVQFLRNKYQKISTYNLIKKCTVINFWENLSPKYKIIRAPCLFGTLEYYQDLWGILANLSTYLKLFAIHSFTNSI